MKTACTLFALFLTVAVGMAAMPDFAKAYVGEQPISKIYVGSDLIWEASAGFVDPRSVPDCVLWMDGQDASTVTLSENLSVVGWQDKAMGYNFVRNGTSTHLLLPASPSYESGLGVRFARTNYLYCASGPSFYTTGSWFLVFTTRDGNPFTGGTVCGWGGNNMGYALCFHSIGTTERPGFGYYAVLGSADTALVAQPPVRAAIWEGQFQPTNVKFFYEEALLRDSVPTAAPGVNSGSRYCIGTAIHGTPGAAIPNMNGTIHEIINYNRILTEAERAQVLAYLKAKWGL